MNALTVQKYRKVGDDHQTHSHPSDSDLQWPINELILNQLVTSGLNNKEIANKYGVSTKDVVRLIRETTDGSTNSNFSWD